MPRAVHNDDLTGVLHTIVVSRQTNGYCRVLSLIHLIYSLVTSKLATAVIRQGGRFANGGIVLSD